MGLLSLNWFKSKKQLELEELKVEEQRIKNNLLERKLKEVKNTDLTKKAPEHSIKPYKNLKLVNNVLTIVLNNGDIISKTNAKESDFIEARESLCEDDLFDLILSIEEKKVIKEKELELAKNKNIIKGFELLKEFSEDFEVIGESVYLVVNGKTINRSIPPLVVEKFAEILGKEDNEEEFESLKKFTLKCFTNPNAQSAEDLYEFLSAHQFKIDKHGNFYAYRRVVSLESSNKALIEFVSNTYTKVKAVWKKRPADYVVTEIDGEYSFHKTNGGGNHTGNIVGFLEELYLNLPTMQEKGYTDAHTRTMSYRIGEVASIPRNEGNDDNSVSCSRGLHIASKAYDYSGFGDTPVLAIINPMDVLAVPKGEVGKLRTCRWFFATVLDENEKYILEDEDFSVEELGDIFEEKCLENMEEYIQNSFAEEVKRHTFTLSGLSSSDMQEIVLSLADMKSAIDDRVVEYW